MKARKGKRYKDEILKFGCNPEERLLKLRKELLCQSYRHGGYREFIVHDSKKRHIKAAPFRDRVVHHALCNVIEPIFDKGFIDDSYACRKDKGTRKAVKRLKQFLRSAYGQIENLKKVTLTDTSVSIKDRGKETYKKSELYVLKCDVSKYFDNIDHALLLDMIKKKISDEKVIWLTNMIIESINTNKDMGKGIPIGNLTSQLFANVYLNELDQFVKHTLRKKQYIRYMDDFIILGDNKRELVRVKLLVGAFLRNSLQLELHSRKSIVHPVWKGIDFLGYVVFERHILLRKDTVMRFVRRIRVYQKRMSRKELEYEKIIRSAMSWVAYAKYARSWKLRKRIGEHLGLKLIE